jgi:hypothetical protein
MHRRAVIFLIGLCGLAPATASALEFNFRPEPGMDPVAIEGFRAAGEMWSALFRDPITVNLDIGFRNLGAATLGETDSVETTVTYAQLRGALTNGAVSPLDQAAVASLQPGAALDMLLNRTSNSPAGGGSATTFLDDDGDANNRTIRLTRANAKALGLLAGNDPGTDASITFNSAFNFDFDPGNGIGANSFSFVFVAAHEIGHALGFISGVDILDLNSPPQGGPFRDDQFTFVSPVDVFRFSPASVANGAGTIDWTADTRRKHFATDGGPVNDGDFAGGRNFGDGQQASHWRDNLDLGIMDPTAGRGEHRAPGPRDIRLFDVIGYETGPAVARFCREPAIAIPDNDPAGVTDALVVADGGTLSDLDVELVADHSWVGDLIFVLRHQQTNTSITLIDRPGVSSGGFGCSGDDIDAALDDDAIDPVESACAGAAPAIGGTFTPADKLQAFVGEQVGGTWSLTLSDNARQDRGSLVSWCLVAGL